MTDRRPDVTVQALVDHYGLEPMPLEGGLFRRTWAGTTGTTGTQATADGAPATVAGAPARADGRPEGSAIIVLLSPADGQFSAMHRLPGDEVWHFYLGDPVELLLLGPDGDHRVVVLGPDVLGGQHVQFTVPAGTWMGGQVAPGGQWSLFGCTMAPGFVSSDYEGGDAGTLCARYPAAAERIRALCRPGAPLRHPAEPEGRTG